MVVVVQYEIQEVYIQWDPEMEPNRKPDVKRGVVVTRAFWRDARGRVAH